MVRVVAPAEVIRRLQAVADAVDEGCSRTATAAKLDLTPAGLIAFLARYDLRGWPVDPAEVRKWAASARPPTFGAGGMNGERPVRRYDVRARDVLAHAARLFGFPLDALTGRGRKHPVASARQAAVWVIRRRVGMSYPEILQFLSVKDHSTLVHAVAKVEERMSIDPDYACKVRTLRWLAEGGEVLPDAGEFVPVAAPAPPPPISTELVWRGRERPEPATPEPVEPVSPWWEKSDDELIGEAIAAHRQRGGDFVEVRG